jgi:hypothetical protein
VMPNIGSVLEASIWILMVSFPDSWKNLNL